MNYVILPEDFAYINEKMQGIIGKEPDMYGEVNYALKRICERLFTEEELAISRKLYKGFYFYVKLHMRLFNGGLSFVEELEKKRFGTYVRINVPVYFPCIDCNKTSLLLVKRLNKYVKDNKDHEDVRKLYEFMQKSREYRDRKFDYEVKPSIRKVNAMPYKAYKALGEDFISRLEQRDKDFYTKLLELAGRPSVRPLKFDKDAPFDCHEQLAIYDEIKVFLSEAIGEKPSDTEAGEWIRKTAEKTFTKDERDFLGAEGTCSGITTDVRFRISEVNGKVRFVERPHGFTYIIRQNVFDVIDKGSEIFGGVWKAPSEYLLKFMNSKLEESGHPVREYYYGRLRWEQERNDLLSKLAVVHGLERHGDITKELATLLAYLYKRKSASKEFKKVSDTMNKKSRVSSTKRRRIAMNNWPEKFWIENGKIFYDGGKTSDAYIFVEEDSEGIAVYYHRTTEDEVLAFVDDDDNFTIVEW